MLSSLLVAALSKLSSSAVILNFNVIALYILETLSHAHISLSKLL